MQLLRMTSSDVIVAIQENFAIEILSACESGLSLLDILRKETGCDVFLDFNLFEPGLFRL